MSAPRHANARWLSVCVASALAVTACTDDSRSAPVVIDTVASTTIAATTIATTTVATTTTLATAPTTPIASAPMAVEITWASSARWPNGSPLSAADLECTRRAGVDSDDPVQRRRYAAVTAIRDDAASGQSVVEFSAPDSDYRRLFDHIVQSVDGMCATTSSQVSVATPTPTTTPTAEIVTSLSLVEAGAAPGVPGALVSGEAAMEIGQPRPVPAGSPIIMSSAVAGPMVSLVFSRIGPLADEVLRRALSLSVDRSAAIAEAVTPAVPITTLAICGPWPAASPLCTGSAFSSTFDVDAAADLLSSAGWSRDPNGYWAKDGVVPALRFVVPGDDQLAADVQSSVAPRLAAAGFDVRVAVCTTECIEANTALPRAVAFDITVATAGVGNDPDIDALVACAIDETAVGLGSCDASVLSALAEARSAMESAARVDAASRLARVLADQALLLPLAPQPRIVSWRSDVITRSPSPVAALSLTDLVAVAPELAAATVQGRLTAAVDRTAWCQQPWWTCGTSVRGVATGEARVASVWDSSASGQLPSALVAGEPRLTLAAVG